MTALDSDSTCSMTHVQQLQLHLLLSLPFTLQCRSAWLSQELTLTDNTLVTGLKIVFADHKWRLIGYRWQVTQCLYKGEYLVGFSTIQNWTLVQDYTNSLHSGSRLRMCLSGTHLACRLHLSTFFVVDYHYSASESQHCSATWHLRAIGCTSLKLPSSIWFPPDDQHHTTQCLQKPPCFWQRLHSTTTIKLYSLQPATNFADH